MRRVLGGRGRWVLAALLGLLVCAQAAPAAVVTEKGYVTMSDGVRLQYVLKRPAEQGRFPTLMTYDDYSASGDALNPLNLLGEATRISLTVEQLLAEGYAVLGVNIRGTACSEGAAGLHEAATWGRDGAEVVGWAARQAWSDGHVGMFGSSFPGLSQIGVAGHRPPHLDAISPIIPVTDWYRTVSYPGGLYDAGWMTSYPLATIGLQSGATAEGTAGDPACPTRVPGRVPTNIALTMPQHPYYDDFWRTQPDTFVDRIDVPVLALNHWQDGSVGSRASEIFLDERLDPARSWFIGNNGGHASSMAPQLTDLQLKFFARYVKGERNGWESTPHYMLEHEASAGVPRWVSTSREWRSERWSKAVEPVALTLHSDGRMDQGDPAADEPTSSYRYPLPSSTPAAGLWPIAGAPDGSLSYSTPRLGRDVEFFGPASLDLSLSSTAADTDVQATLTDVRPDGQELYVQRGWLRLSHRKLDAARSTPLRPEHTHLETDARPLTPGETVAARLEIQPFNHVFRAGSSIRVTIDAPTAPTGDPAAMVFDLRRDPATNKIHHDRAHPSRLVLPQIPGGRARATLPACGSVESQPCRENAIAIPTGTLTIAEPSPLGLPAPTRCVSRRRFTIRLRAPRGQHLRSARVYVNGRRVRVLRGRRLRAVVDLRGLPAGRVRVRVLARTSKGRVITNERRYRTCVAARRA